MLRMVLGLVGVQFAPDPTGAVEEIDLSNLRVDTFSNGGVLNMQDDRIVRGGTFAPRHAAQRPKVLHECPIE